MLELLSERVGASGAVLGVDIDPAHVRQAGELIQQRGLGNVRVIEADARATGLPARSCDLACMRLLLVNIPDPERVIAELVRLVRPGGWIACEEVDAAASICHPPNEAYDTLVAVFRDLYARNGADLFIGRHLRHLLGESGLVELGVEARADILPAGHSRRTVMLDLLWSMRPKMSRAGLLTASEHERLDTEARAHLARPDTLLMPVLSFLAWGRVPEGSR